MMKKRAAPRPKRAEPSSATPYKAASKTSAGKKAASKKITAPLRHKPKGSPKERLAYLNKGEMAALVKKKGSPARKGPKGLPSFADDSASSKDVSRGDSSGTKGSGSTKTSTGSVSKSSGGYNSGTSGSKGGGASTQSPGMGRNEGRVGPSSPMGGQGTSFATNKAARDDTLRRAYGIDDIRGRMGPYKGPLKGGLMDDDVYGPFNPNNPYTIREQEDFIKSLAGKRDAFNRSVVSDRAANALGGYRTPRSGLTYRPPSDMRTPQEVREQAARFGDEMGKADAEADREYFGYNKPSFVSGIRASVARSQASGLTPDIKVGKPRLKAGGLVNNKPRKSFKKK